MGQERNLAQTGSPATCQLECGRHVLSAAVALGLLGTQRGWMSGTVFVGGVMAFLFASPAK
jgi:hypothetical protein